MDLSDSLIIIPVEIYIQQTSEAEDGRLSARDRLIDLCLHRTLKNGSKNRSDRLDDTVVCSCKYLSLSKAAKSSKKIISIK